MYQQRVGPRFEHREKAGRRVQAAPCLSARFRHLKSLTVGLAYYDHDGVTKNSQVKYTVNLDHAKSVLLFNCPNSECIRGDFDLTKELEDACAKRRTTATGAIACKGWQSKTAIDSVHCNNVLRYTLSLGY